MPGKREFDLHLSLVEGNRKQHAAWRIYGGLLGAIVALSYFRTVALSHCCTTTHIILMLCGNNISTIEQYDKHRTVSHSPCNVVCK